MLGINENKKLKSIISDIQPSFNITHNNKPVNKQEKLKQISRESHA